MISLAKVTSPESRILGVVVKVACPLVLAIILIAGLWPFHAPKNQVSWLSGGNGLRFGKHGSIMSAAPLGVTGPQSGNSCTIELWLQPARTDTQGTVLAFYDPAGGMAPFLLRQFHGGLAVGRMSHDRPARQSEIFVDHVFSGSRPVFVTLGSGAAGTSAYVDGKLLKRVPYFAFSGVDLQGELVVGDAPTTPFNWPGTVKGLAVYDRELNDTEVSREFAEWTQTGRPNPAKDADVVARYLFDEGEGGVVRNQANPATNLMIPGRYRMFQQKFLERPWDEFSPAWRYWKDVAINVAGFIPLGLCFRAYFGVILKIERAAWLTLGFGFAISLTIEVLQSYLPTRDSGMTDLITNTLGTLLGSAFCAWCLESNWFTKRNRASVLGPETGPNNGALSGRTAVANEP